MSESTEAHCRRLSAMAEFLRADARKEARRAQRKGADVTLCHARQELFEADARALDEAVRLIVRTPKLMKLRVEMREWLKPEVVKEPDRTFFWKLVDAAAPEPQHPTLAETR